MLQFFRVMLCAPDLSTLIVFLREETRMFARVHSVCCAVLMLLLSVASVQQTSYT